MVFLPKQDRQILRVKLKLKESRRPGKTIIVLIKHKNTMRGACVAPAIINMSKLEPFLFVGTIKGHTTRRASVTNASTSKRIPWKALDCVRTGKDWRKI